MANPPRRTMSSREAAEAVFKTVAAKSVEIPVKKPAVPGARELVSLRIDRDILDHFQEAGPGWQERVNDALRKAIGK